MKSLVFLMLAMSTSMGLQLPTNAAPSGKHQTKLATEPGYAVRLVVNAWEGVAIRARLALAGQTVTSDTYDKSGHTSIALNVNGLKPGIYTATLTLIKTDLLNENAGNQLQTVLEYLMFAQGEDLTIISVGNHSLPSPSIRTQRYDLSTAWGKDPDQIPDLPFGKDYYARYRIGDTCKIVFFVGPFNATMQDIQALEAKGNTPTGTVTATNPIQPMASADISWKTIYAWEANPQEALTMSVPNNGGVVIGTNGPTIAHGVDLGQPGHTEAWLDSLHLDAALTAELLPYLSLRGQAALDYVIAHRLTLDRSQVDQIDQALQPQEVSQVANHYKADVGRDQAFDKLPEPVETVYASIYYQYGTKAPATLKSLEQGDYEGAIAELRKTDAWEHPLVAGLQNRRNLEASYLQDAINNGVLTGKPQ